MKKVILVAVAIMFTCLVLWSCTEDKSTEPDNKAPVCSIIFPPDSSKITVGSPINITLETDDEDGEIEEIKLYLDDVELNVKADSMYQYLISTDQMGPGFYKLKALTRDNDGSETTDESNFELTLDLSMIVVSPAGCEVWPMGTSRLIKWQSNLNEPVKIDLYRSGAFCTEIASSTVNDGEYSWAIPADLTAADDYSIRICGENSTGIFDTVNSNFSISEVSSDPYITLLSPNDSENLLAGETKEIKWITNIDGYVKIELLRSGVLYGIISENIPNNGTYSWTVPTTVPDDINFQIKITSLLIDNVSDISDSYLKVMRFYLSSQTLQEIWEPGTSYAIEWISSEFLDNSNIVLELRKNGVFHSSIASNIANSGSHNFIMPYSVESGENYRIRIRLYNDVTTFDDSDGIIQVAEKIKVLSPVGSESILSGRPMGISWSDNISDNVKIELYKAEILNSVISNSTLSDGNYLWEVPANQAVGEDYKIRVTKAGTDEVAGISNNNFTILTPSIILTYPTGGQNWDVGSSQAITWTDNIPENVKIELFKNGIYNTTLTSSTPSDGSYELYVPETIAGGTDYKIRITSASYTTINDESDGYMTVLPSIVISYPNGGDILNSGSTYQINWVDQISSNVKIDLYKNGVFNTTIASSVPSNGSYSWTVPYTVAAGSDYKIRISSTVSSAIYDESGANFTVPAALDLISPVGNEICISGTMRDIIWLDNIAENVKIELYKGGSLYNTINSSTWSDGIYHWSIPDITIDDDDFSMRITSTDNGQISDESDSNLKLNNGRVFVQGGTFEMGDHFSEGQARELPVHSVTLSDFFIGKYEITQTEWSKYMPFSYISEEYGKGNDYPVYCVKWYSILKYCNLRSIAEGMTPCYTINGSTDPADWGDVPVGYNAVWSAAICNWSVNGYRLPTEAEWEYAARGGINWNDNFKYSGSNTLDEVAWNTENNSPSGSKPVGLKAPNQLGIYDMSGNVMEWCWDSHAYDDNYYQYCYNLGTVINPYGSNAFNTRMLRGGDWVNTNTQCRTASRGGYYAGYYYYYMGFRIARTQE